MSRRVKVVVGASSDDDLLLPRPPGLLRRFWARHPRTVDVLVAVAAFILTVPGVAVRAGMPAPSVGEAWMAVGLLAIGSAALIWRRRFPIVVYVVAVLPSLATSPAISPLGHVLAAFASYAVAVYRSTRASWIAFAATASAMVLYSITALATGAIDLPYAIGGAASGVVTTLVGSLIGVNVGGRRRYTEALIDRSRQLLVERDQQARLAAGAERTRIAREMHDIVSHSLTVIVALSEGAASAGSLDRARRASRGAADTARGALDEMRAMLGVLREHGDERSPLEPLAPVDPAEVVEAAQRAGVPVVLESVGSRANLPRGVRFALGRVVQESVTNAMRHAPRATRVTLRIGVDSARVVVTVRNDGALRAATDRSGGFGLRGLRERVELVGGSLQAGTAREGEWMLRAELPLDPAHPESRANA